MVPVKTNNPNSTPKTKNFEVTITRSNFGLKILNKLTKKTIFDTTLGPLIFANQFLQVIMFIEQNIFNFKIFNSVQ